MAGRAALCQRDREGLKEDIDRIAARGSFGRAIEASGTILRAGLAALEGRTMEAMALYRDALGVWRQPELPWDEALTGIDMFTVLPATDPAVREAVETSRRIPTDLGVTPLLERLDSLVAVSGSTQCR